jgi:uncharacterized phage protein gp47/JayE
MGVEVESLRTYADQVLTDIEAKTSQDTPPIAIAYNRIISNAVAAMVLINNLHNVDQRKECFPQTATVDVGLPFWAELTARPRNNGVQANMQIIVTGDNGTVIGTYSTGAQWKGANGILYQTSTGGTISGGSASIAILANTAGEEGTLTIGDTVRLTSSITGLDSVGTVTAINIPGAEAESIDSWRNAIVQLVAFPPQIGTAAWFLTQALTVDGITRAYPYSDEDYPGRVLIYAVADANVDGQPTSPQLAAIEAVFTDAYKDILWATGTLPSGDKRVEAFASDVDEYNVVITEGSPALSSTLKTTVEAAIDNYFLTRNPYLKGLSLENQGVVEKVAIIAVAQNTIEAEVGETGRIADIELQKVGEPAADLYTLDIGTRAKANISYT